MQGAIYYQNYGKKEEAIKSYENALKFALEDDESATLWNRKGNALFELGSFQDALECYEKALELEPENDIFWSNRGVTLLELNRFEEALESFNRALTINPENEDAKILKEECLENL